MRLIDRKSRLTAMVLLIVFWFVMVGVTILAAICGLESWTEIRVASLSAVISAGLSIFYIHCVPDKKVGTKYFLFLVLTIPAILASVAVVGVLVYAWLAWKLPSDDALYTVFQAYFAMNLVGIPLRIVYAD